ncbi:MAG: DnaJ domain-containing protein [Clostridiales bacterium]|nr:DnaJ domain-containing protein [Clostridiales bacterium]
MRDYYTILGVERGADKTRLKRAYYEQVKLHPPETDPDGFQALREAYAFLTDDQKRAGYDKQLELPPELSEVLLTADALFRSDRYKEAISKLKKAERKFPASEEIGILLGRSYLENNNYKYAIDQFRKTSQKHPASQEAARHLAMAYMKRGFTIKANDQFRAAIEIDSRDAETWAIYLGFVRHHRDAEYGRVMTEVDAIDPEMFKERYIVYGGSALEVAEGWDSDFDKALVWCEKFTRFFLRDPKPLEAECNMALSLISHFLETDRAADAVLTLYDKLRTSNCNEQRGKKLDQFKARMDFLTFKRECGYDPALIDLTDLLVSGIITSYEEVYLCQMEIHIVSKPEKFRKNLRDMRTAYPGYFELHKDFYLDVINPHKEQKLIEKTYRKSTSLHKKYPKAFRADSLQEYMMDPDKAFKVYDKSQAKNVHLLRAFTQLFGGADRDPDDHPDEDLSDELVNELYEEDWDDDDDGEQMPYRRTERKVGRNEMCPCGSGKKYKHCCGQNAGV